MQILSELPPPAKFNCQQNSAMGTTSKILQQPQPVKIGHQCKNWAGLKKKERCQGAAWKH
jgi:hypothetical protein